MSTSFLPLVSVVMAAHDEAPTVGDIVRDCLKTVPAESEVLVVDDGSGDRTATVARRAGATVFRLPRNRGKGHAMRWGMLHARAPVIAMLDADGQDDPADLRALIEALPADGGLVVGSRFLGTLEPDAITRVNALGNRGLTAVINGLYGSTLTDTQAGMRVIDRGTLSRCQLGADGFDFETDLLLAVLEAGRRVVEVGVKRKPRAAGHSHLSSVRDGARILRRILERRARSLRR